jgi:hypothetical protein
MSLKGQKRLWRPFDRHVCSTSDSSPLWCTAQVGSLGPPSDIFTDRGLIRARRDLQACVTHITLFALTSYVNLGNVWTFADQRGGDLFND